MYTREISRDSKISFYALLLCEEGFGAVHAALKLRNGDYGNNEILLCMCAEYENSVSRELRIQHFVALQFGKSEAVLNFLSAFCCFRRKLGSFRFANKISMRAIYVGG